MISKTIKLLVFTVLCVSLSVTAFAQAQSGTGQISGVILDSNNAIVPNATVKLVNKDTGLNKTTNTNSDGIYSFILLPPGKYEVSASAGGFAEQKLEVQVQVGRSTDANFTLGVQGASAVVEVTAEGVQTTQSNSDAVLSDTAISNLPINGRRFQDFATLTPTAQIDTERNQISLSGQRGINTNINVDGVDYNQPFFGGIRGGERSNFAPTIPQESIKEFQVVAAGYSAEFGRSSGGIVNVVTKGGGNNFRGTVFYLIRPEKLARNHAFVKALEEQNNFKIKAAPTQQQFGGSFGGPIVKNKLFFFGSYEQQTFRADRQVIFQGIDSVITRTANNQEAYDYFNSLETGYKLTNDAWTALGRLDWNPNSNNNFNFRYSWNKGRGENSVSVGDAGTLFNPIVNSALSQEGTEKDRNNVLVTQWTSTISSNLVNDFRFQYARGDRPRIANALTPAVSVNNVGFYGTRSFLPTTQTDTRLQFVESLSVISGNHTMKFGGEFSDVFADQKFGFNQFGAYSFSVSGTDALQRMSISPANPRRFDTNTFYNKQIGNLEAAFNVQELAFYGQDAWRITPKFTLNFGVRFEKQFNPEAELGNTAIIDLLKNAQFPIRGNKPYDPTTIPDSEWQVGPRLGFAWDLEGNGKSVFRGFTGLYYARTPLLIIAGPLNNFRIPAGDVSTQIPFTVPTTLTANTAAGVTAYNNFLATNPGYVSILTGTGLACPAVVNPGDARNCLPNSVFRQFALIGINANSFQLSNLPNLSATQVTQIAGALGLGVTPGIGANLIGMDENFRNPRSMQFGFGYEREVFQGVVFGIDYSQVNTTRLQRNRDINLPTPTLADCTNNTAQRPCFNRNIRPVPTLGRVLTRESSGLSQFRSLTFRTRIVRKWANINAYYTLSRNKSDDDNERNATGLFYENSFDLRAEYGLARLDRKHQFTANPVFFLPYGVEVSSAIRLRSGLPIDATVGSDVNRDSINNDRPYTVAGVSFQRNAFRNRNEYGVDLRIQKGIKFGENRRLVLSSEFFNLFNNANIQFGGDQLNYCSTTTRDVNCGLNGQTNVNFRQLRNTSGQLITSGNFTRTPVFQMQFGARLQF